MHDSNATCPLCLHPGSVSFWSDARREYLRCAQCALTWVPSRYHLTAGDERAEYDLHQNSPEDLGYRRFLSRLATPLRAQLDAGAVGLDFGCGPGPTLSLMVEEAGYTADIYDLYYAPNALVFERDYDFITATEVVEHLRSPRDELWRLWSMLKPGGVLALMTKLARDAEAFSTWHYKNDATHIAFFSETTFGWLASTWQCEVEFVAADVIFLHKPS